MKFNTPQTLKQISEILNCDFVGDENFPVSGMNEIHVVKNGDIVFVDHPKYYKKALSSDVSVILINKRVTCPEGKSLLISENPFNDFNKLAKHFKPFKISHQSIDKNAKIGKGTKLQPNIFIGPNVQIGMNCLINANVTIVSDTIIGNNVIIGSGTISHIPNVKVKVDGTSLLGGVLDHRSMDLGLSLTSSTGVTNDPEVNRSI